MGRDRRLCAWLQPGTAARLKAGLPKAPMASCSRSWAPLPLQQTLMDSATTHEPTYLLLPLAPAGGMPALHQILRDLHLWPLWPPMGLPALLPPVLQPLPLTGNGAPNFRQGAGRLPFPNPCHDFASFEFITASTANAWGLPVIYPPAFTVEHGLGQHRHMMSRKHPILCILYRIFAEYCIPISIFLQIYS